MLVWLCGLWPRALQGLFVCLFVCLLWSLYPGVTWKYSTQRHALPQSIDSRFSCTLLSFSFSTDTWYFSFSLLNILLKSQCEKKMHSQYLTSCPLALKFSVFYMFVFQLSFLIQEVFSLFILSVSSPKSFTLFGLVSQLLCSFSLTLFAFLSLHIFSSSNAKPRFASTRMTPPFLHPARHHLPALLPGADCCSSQRVCACSFCILIFAGLFFCQFTQAPLLGSHK